MQQHVIARVMAPLARSSPGNLGARVGTHRAPLMRACKCCCSGGTPYVAQGSSKDSTSGHLGGRLVGGCRGRCQQEFGAGYTRTVLGDGGILLLPFGRGTSSLVRGHSDPTHQRPAARAPACGMSGRGPWPWRRGSKGLEGAPRANDPAGDKQHQRFRSRRLL